MAEYFWKMVRAIHIYAKIKHCLPFGGPMEEDRNQEPRERLRNILDSDENDLNPQPVPGLEPQPREQPRAQPQTPARSPLEQLPHLKQPVEASPPAETKADTPKPKATVSPSITGKLPQSKQPAQGTGMQAAKSQAKKDMPRLEKFLRALWTLASLISMIVTIVVVIVVVIAFWAYRDIKLPEGVDVTMLNKLLGGLYSNFEKLDRATIRATIPVDAQIPLDISVPVQTTTQITLADEVVIPNAKVVINTGGLNINSNARVTLPAGTPLNVNLNFNLPVQTSIPVHLDVPVVIPMTETELHEPFVGLQDVVQPVYCIVDPNATNLDSQLICR
jgi:hypothetical protein